MDNHGIGKILNSNNNKYKFIMRKKIYIMLAAIMVTFASCGHSDKNLRECVRAMNELSDSGLDSDFVDFDKVEYDGHTVTMTYTFDEEILDYDGIVANEESFRSNMLMGFVNNLNEGFRKFLEAIIEADADLNVVYNVGNPDKAISFTFTAKELKDNLNDSDDNPLALLESVVENTRLQTPMPVDEGMVMADAFLDDHYFTFIYECDESVYDLNFMEESMDELKELMVEEVSDSNDTMLKLMRDLLKKTHYGLKYKYVGTSSGKEISVCLESEEL